MPLLGALEEQQRRSQTICFLLDTSKGTNDNCEKKLDEFMETIYDTIRICAKENQDIEYAVDVMLYGEKTYWYTASGPETIEDFVWDPIIANGEACPSMAFELLNDRLDLYIKRTSLLPIIFCVSANRTTANYDRALTALKLNRIYQKALKIGVPIGIDSDVELLEKFTGTREAIISINDIDSSLAKRIINPIEIGPGAELDKPLPRLDVFFVFDTSEEMAGAKIDMLNKSLKELPISLRDIIPNANIYFSVLKYGGSPEWIVNEASPGQMLIGWKDLEAGGTLKSNQALAMLLERLQAYSLTKLYDYMPVIILVNANKAEEVDGNVLEQLRKVVWFKHALKIGFAVGDDSDLKMLSMFTGNMEAVISTSDLDLFRRLLVPRRVGEYMEDIPGGKIETAIPPFTTEICLPSGKVVVDEKVLAVKKCQVRACKLEEAEDILFSVCYMTSDDWDEYLYVTNSGKENLIVKHSIGKYGDSVVLSGSEKECEYLIEPNENSTVHNRFSISVSVQNNNLVIKNKSDDLVTVLETIIPGATVKMKKNSALLLADGTVCFELSIEDDDWW